MNKVTTSWHFSWISSVSTMILIAMVFLGMILQAQDLGEKIKPKLRLSYINQLGASTEVKASVYYVEEGERIFCEGAPIGFYTDEDAENLFRQVIVDHKGEAVLQLDEEGLAAFEQQPGHYYFFAQIEKNDKYRSRDEEMYISDAEIRLDLVNMDTLKLLKATFLGSSDSAGYMLPVSNVPLKVFVTRAFAMLPVGGDFNYTDEEGRIEITFPNDIPGDVDGNINLIVKVDESDDYGTVVMEKQIDWGVPVQAKSPIANRSLIGDRSNAPIFMVVSINLILVGIWGCLIYLIYGLFRIRRIGSSKS